MRTLSFAVAAFAAASVAFAQMPPIPAAKAARVGGFLERPDAAKGRVVFVNAQKIVPENELTNVAVRLSRFLHAKIAVVPGADVTCKTAQAALKGIENASAGVFLVEHPDCPNTILVAPESKWAFVNVSALAADKAEPPFVAARTRKEMVRAFLSLCGAYDSGYANSLMGNVDSLKALDKFIDDSPPMDVVGRSRKFLPLIGVDTRSMTTYIQAVKEGWAPAPTNDVQKAIWERIHAEKERGPSNPLRIAPPKPNVAK